MLLLEITPFQYMLDVLMSRLKRDNSEKREARRKATKWRPVGRYWFQFSVLMCV